ncbi:hypothetical protein, partial [Salinigranum halophilum]|uniref:hypothetical protein n=1 Tax=Salinigranum halophilum TaxID=2565931 RepID=UPI0026E539D0
FILQSKFYSCKRLHKLRVYHSPKTVTFEFVFTSGSVEFFRNYLIISMVSNTADSSADSSADSNANTNTNTNTYATTQSSPAKSSQAVAVVAAETAVAKSQSITSIARSPTVGHYGGVSHSVTGSKTIAPASVAPARTISSMAVAMVEAHGSCHGQASQGEDYEFHHFEGFEGCGLLFVVMAVF